MPTAIPLIENLSTGPGQRRTFAGLILALVVGGAVTGQAAGVKLLNVSYDVTREFYQELNPVFAADYKDKTGDVVTISQSHGGSSKQAQSVAGGLEADVVTMNQPTDVDLLATVRLLPANWASRLPNHSVPYTSTIVFVVRKRNPKHIKTWDDLIQPGVAVVIPNPKTSGNGRYSYLAAWGHVKKTGGTDQQAQDFLGKLFANVPVLDTGGRGATTTFANHGIGDVLLSLKTKPRRSGTILVKTPRRWSFRQTAFWRKIQSRGWIATWRDITRKRPPARTWNFCTARPVRSWRRNIISAPRARRRWRNIRTGSRR